MPPRFQGSQFRFRQHSLILGIFVLFSSKIACFLWSWRDSNLRPHRCERCVLTLRRMLRDQLNYKTMCSICPLCLLCLLCDSSPPFTTCPIRLLDTVLCYF